MIKVGEHIIDKNGVEWAVARAYKWPKWTDFDLINVVTGEYSYIRDYE